jgi:hypothetical protein
MSALPMPRLFLALVLVALPARAQIQRLPAPDSSAGNGFGAAVALSGDRLIVGASGEATCGENAGAAYVYRRGADGRYHFEARFAPADCQAGRFFGRAVALDGERALVAGVQPFLGAPRANPVLLFEQQGARWVEVARLHPPDSVRALGFGAAVALRGDRAVVTAEGDAGAGRPGSAYVYERRADGHWRLAARITAPGRFGAFAVLDGDRLAVTAPPVEERGEGTVYLYEHDGGGRWRQATRLDGFSDLHLRCALSGDRLIVGHSRGGTGRRGIAVVYRRHTSGAWVPEATLRPRTAYELGGFGVAVALDGERALVAGYTEQLRLPFNIDRVVYVFGVEGGRWVETQVVDVGSTAFGVALDVEGRHAVIGEAGDGAPGAAYVAELF